MAHQSGYSFDNRDAASVTAMGLREWLLLFLLALLWGGSFFFNELALRDFRPLSVVVGRTGLATLVLLGLLKARALGLPSSLKLWKAFFVMGALNNLIPFALIVWGQTQIDSGLAAILNATSPLFGILLAGLLTSDERLSAGRFAGVLLGLAGVTVLIGPDVLKGLGTQVVAQVAVLGAACAYALAAIYGRRFKDLPPLVTATGMLTGTTVMGLPLALWLERPWQAHPSVISLSAVLSLALLSTAVAYLIYFDILARAGATNLLLVTFLIPISALFLGSLLLGETLSWRTMFGMALIFAGLAVIDGRLLKAHAALSDLGSS